MRIGFWNEIPPKVDLSKIPNDLHRAAKKILTKMEYSVPMTEAQLLERCQIRKQSLVHCLREMKNIGIVKRVSGRGVRNDPFYYAFTG